VFNLLLLDSLLAASADAKALAELARAQGLDAVELLDADATRARLLAALRSATEACAIGDLLLVTFAGHGGRLPNVAGVGEAGKQSASWCLYDGQWLEQELQAMLRRLPAGAHAVVLGDTCYTGTVTRAAPPASTAGDIHGQRLRLMPMAVTIKTYTAHKAFYDRLHKDTARALAATPDEPPTLLFAAAQDNQTAYEQGYHGAFTEQVLNVWNDGAFTGTWAQFAQQVRMRMPAHQSPALSSRGAAQALLKKRPFST
jgi:hypothetical protein